MREMTYNGLCRPFGELPCDKCIDAHNTGSGSHPLQNPKYERQTHEQHTPLHVAQKPVVNIQNNLD